MQLEGNDANSIFIPFGFDPPVHASNVSAQSKKRSPRDRFVNFDFNHQLARRAPRPSIATTYKNDTRHRVLRHWVTPRAQITQ